MRPQRSAPAPLSGSCLWKNVKPWNTCVSCCVSFPFVSPNGILKEPRHICLKSLIRRKLQKNIKVSWIRSMSKSASNLLPHFIFRESWDKLGLREWRCSFWNHIFYTLNESGGDLWPIYVHEEDKRQKRPFRIPNSSPLTMMSREKGAGKGVKNFRLRFEKGRKRVKRIHDLFQWLRRRRGPLSYLWFPTEIRIRDSEGADFGTLEEKGRNHYTVSRPLTNLSFLEVNF